MANQTASSEASQNDKVIISEEVIAMIAALSISDEPGLTFKKVRDKDISVHLDGSRVSITVSIMINYGTKLPELVDDIQKKVKTSVENMTGLSVAAVNVNVDGMNVEKADIQS